MLNIQGVINEMNAQYQKKRSETQLTLGALITALKAMPPDSVVANISGAHSYRGYYCDLAFKLTSGTRPAKELLAECRDAMGNVFTGYKGGDYIMSTLTPLWIAEYGHCGLKLMAVHAGGELETEDDDL